MRVIFALFLVGTFWSCSETTPVGDISSLDPDFFNLIEFVEQQQAQLASKSITKSVTVNDISETKEISVVDWELELAPFEQSNIDRPGFWDTYSVDTLTHANGRAMISYQALDSSNFTKLIEVMWSDLSAPLDSVYSISIRNGFDSYIANTSQQLKWWNGGYEIMSAQEAVLLDERSLSIKSNWESDFVCPFSEEGIKAKR